MLNKWIPIRKYCELYKVQKGVFRYAMRNGNAEKYIKKIDSVEYVNVAYLDKIKAKRKRIWNNSHDMFFELEEIYGEDGLLEIIEERSKSLRRYVVFGLFTRIDNMAHSNVSINKQLLEFYEFAKELLEEQR